MVVVRPLIHAAHHLRRFSSAAAGKVHALNFVAEKVRFSSSSLSSDEHVLQNLPQGAQIHLDFFGEPISFFGVENGENLENVVAALDRFEIGLVTKGKAFTGNFPMKLEGACCVRLLTLFSFSYIRFALFHFRFLTRKNRRRRGIW